MPRYIALTGYPQAGKSEVQKIMNRRYGFASVDDAKPLREGVKLLYGLSDWHVETQEGKASLVEINGRECSVRELLGELGKYLEERDPFHMPRLAVASCELDQQAPGFVFGSVRRQQPLYFAALDGGFVLEIVRKGCVPSSDFDEYDRSRISATIENHYDPEDPVGSARRLENAVAAIFDPLIAAYAA